MGRPRIEWTDTQLRAIMGALAALDRDFPRDNVRFLDGLVASVRAATGRVYGATAYGRLLRDVAPQAGVRRRPSTPTIQAAVLRAQALERGAIDAAANATARVPAAARVAPDAELGRGQSAVVRDGAGGGADRDAGHAATVDVDALRASLAPLVRELMRESIGPVHALLARLERPDVTGGGQAGQLQLTTVALQDAHGRIRRLEMQLAELRGELGAARAARDLASAHVSRMLEDLHRAIAAAGQDTQSLARAAGQLAGTEKFLKAQNDAVRLQAAAEADALRTQNRQFRKRIDHLVLDNDQYRRALGNRANGKPASGG